MLLKKTPLAAQYVRKLDEINDQLCFSAFAADELRRSVAPKTISAPDAFTTEVFPHNPHASRIHIRLADLDRFQQLSLSQASSNSLQVGIEHLQAYLDEVRELGAELITTALPRNSDEPSDEYLKRQLVAWDGPNLDRVFDTIVYLRRRRNYLVHLHTKPASELRTSIGLAPRLTAYWASTPINLFGFDFGNETLGTFRVDDGYAIMNLLRVCLLKIDAAVAALLPVPIVMRRTADDLLARGGVANASVLARKTRKLMSMDYGGEISSAEADAAARAAYEANAPA